MSSNIKVAVGADVRAWAKANDVAVGARGKFSDAVIEQFNKANRGAMRYEPGNVKMIGLKVAVKSQKTGNLRKEVRQFTIPQVRKAAGVESTRGPLSSKALEAAALALSATK